MAKFCTNCGNKLEEGASFCTNCGTKVEGEHEPKKRKGFLGILNETIQTTQQTKQEIRNRPKTGEEILKGLTGGTFKSRSFLSKLTKNGLSVSDGDSIIGKIKKEIESGELENEDIEKRLDEIIDEYSRSVEHSFRRYVFSSPKDAPKDKLKKLFDSYGIVSRNYVNCTKFIRQKINPIKYNIITDEEFDKKISEWVNEYTCMIHGSGIVLFSSIIYGDQPGIFCENYIELLKENNLTEIDGYEIKALIEEEIDNRKLKKDQIKSRLDYYLDMKNNESKKRLTEITTYGLFIITEKTKERNSVDYLNALQRQENNLEKHLKENNVKKEKRDKFLKRLNDNYLTGDEFYHIGEKIVEDIDNNELKPEEVEDRIEYYINKLSKGNNDPKAVLSNLTGFTENQESQLKTSFTNELKENLLNEEEGEEICSDISEQLISANMKNEDVKKEIKSKINEKRDDKLYDFYKKAINGLTLEMVVMDGTTEIVRNRNKIGLNKVNGGLATLGSGMLFGGSGALMGAAMATAVNSSAKDEKQDVVSLPKFKFVDVIVQCLKDRLVYNGYEIYYKDMIKVERIDNSVFVHMEKYKPLQFRAPSKLKLSDDEQREFIINGFYKIIHEKGKCIPDELFKKIEEENFSEQSKETVSTADELMKYAELYKQGLLTEEEFNEIKKKLLGL